MSDQADILSHTLIRLGLEAPEVEIYIHLLKSGTISALEISRTLHIARTRVYRILDKLQGKGLVVQKFDTLGLKFSASPYSQLELLVAERQSQLTSLRESMPIVLSELEKISRQPNSGSQVLYHHGIDGLKHVTWNSLRAKDELRIYEVSDSMTAFLPQSFSERVREALVSNRIHTLQLTNLKEIHAYTKITKIITDYWSPRYIPVSSLSIKSEILIYNNVTAMYHYQDNDMFCVEIMNDDLSLMQKQLFDFVWRSAKPMKKIGVTGEAKI